MSPILTQLGLTPEIIQRHVIAINRSPARPDYRAKSRERQAALRRERKRMGLNLNTGEPLKRRPNGQRAPRPYVTPLTRYRSETKAEWRRRLQAAGIATI